MNKISKSNVPAVSKSPNGKIMSDEDKKINLNALKNKDPFATNILDTASRVAVYKFVSKKNEWKKLDVEGSLFLFERMVEPLHSFVVMNTLALHLFMQPITVDLEFQDRNPFLLYKSSNDIFGIWFIDRDDCERIKTLIMSLTDNARERRLKREKSKVSPEKAKESNSNLLYKQLFPNNSGPEQPIDLLQLLNNAKQAYSQSGSAAAGINDSDGSDLARSSSSVEPKPIISKRDLFLSSSQTQYVKPEPRRIGVPITSTTTSLSPSCCSIAAPIIEQETRSQPLNPILQMLMSNPSTEPAQSQQDQFSLDLKRKLNIQSSQSIPNNLTASPILVTTPSNPLIFNGLLDEASLSSSASMNHLLKRPITLQDFEENILNESSTSTPSNANQQPQSSKMFFIPGDQVVYDAKDQHNTSQLSTRTSSSSTSSSDDSDSENSEPTSLTNLPLLLTPAAFESSSASSTTSSSFQHNANLFFNQPQQFDFNFIEQFNNPNSNSLAAGLFFPNPSLNPLSFDLSDLGLSVPSNLNSNNVVNTNFNVPLMTKNQLQQVLIHLLNTDDNFLTTLHNAYLNINNQQSFPIQQKQGTKSNVTGVAKVFTQKKPLNLKKNDEMTYAAVVSADGK